MGRREDVLVPARFLLTIGHLVVVILAYSSAPGNVAAGLPASASSGEVAAAAQLNGSLGLSVFALGVQLFGLLSGATLLLNALNAMHCLLHFMGGVLTAWFIADQWASGAFWYIMVFFSLLPGAAEVAAILLQRQSGRR